MLLLYLNKASVHLTEIEFHETGKMQCRLALQHTLYQPGANLNHAEHVNESFNMFIASYLNTSSLIAQIFVGNSVATLSTEVCCLYSNTSQLM